MYFLIFTLSDENYSLLCSYKEKEEVEEKWVHIFSACLIWIYWILFSGLGGLVGRLITFDTTGIDFALTALFVVILLEQIKGSKANFMPQIVAVAVTVVLHLWKGNTLLSVFGGTLTYMCLVQFVFG